MFIHHLPTTSSMSGLLAKSPEDFGSLWNLGPWFTYNRLDCRNFYLQKRKNNLKTPSTAKLFFLFEVFSLFFSFSSCTFGSLVLHSRTVQRPIHALFVPKNNDIAVESLKFWSNLIIQSCLRQGNWKNFYNVPSKMICSSASNVLTLRSSNVFDWKIP